MRLVLYNFFVNRHPGISYRYHKMHDNAVGITRAFSWLYLLLLNFAYYCLWMHFLGDLQGDDEPAKPPRLFVGSVSEAYNDKYSLSLEAYAKYMKDYDVISFDLFDTLLFRPLENPTDVFYFVGEELLYLNFKERRIEAENVARKLCHKRYGHTEVTFEEIYACFSKMTGRDATECMRAEITCEKRLLYANSFMKAVWERALYEGKKLVITTDMYMPRDTIEAILKENGYTGYDRIYLSGELKQSKADGSVYDLLKKDFLNKRILHIGDNTYSDKTMAIRHNIATLFYPKTAVSKNMALSKDMSPITRSAYRGLVKNRLYTGGQRYNQMYEYGYVYGGLFVLGYCTYIHNLASNTGERILFLSRDGDTLKQVYDYLYPDDDTQYMYWSRKVATKLMAAYDKKDYFRRFLYHKVNQGYRMGNIIKAMDLPEEIFGDDITSEEMLTDRNVEKLKACIDLHWYMVLMAYEDEMQAAKAYIESMLKDCRKAVAVDIGWAGSGAISLGFLTERVWQIPCSIRGFIAGANSKRTPDCEAAEGFIKSGRLSSYLFSSEDNRDIYNIHDAAEGDNIFWEILLSSPTGQFMGFQTKRRERKYAYAQYIKEADVTLHFAECELPTDKVMDIRSGILDFVKDYTKAYKDIPYMYRISGRDSYAPMLYAIRDKRRYLRDIARQMQFEINVV